MPSHFALTMMTHILHAAAIAALTVFVAPASAGEALPVEWSQLPDPSAQEYEDPYRDLAPELMSDLMVLVRLREEITVEGLANEKRRQFEARSSEIEDRLQKAGIDVEWLLSQRWVVADRRQRAAVAANETLNGQPVEMTGFLILAPPTESGEARAYLLPDRAVCNHLPPPPPNQLVRLLAKSALKITGSCVPVAVRGMLRAEETRHEVVVIDHSLPMWSAWSLTTDDVRKAGMSAFDQQSSQ